MPLKTQGMFKKKKKKGSVSTELGASRPSLREPQISADQLGVLTARWVMRGG